MKENCLNITVSAWENYFEAHHPKPVNLWAWLNSAKYAARVQQIRATQDKAERDRLKATLPAITPSGLFSHREEAGLTQHSGLIQFDIDGLTPEEAEYLKGQLCNLQEVAYLGLSVSGKGLWGLVAIAHPDKHRQHFEALAKDFLEWGVVLDKAPANVASLRGYSWDDKAYFNPKAKVYTKTICKVQQGGLKCPIPQGIEARKVEACLEQLEAGRIDITANYRDWLTVGFSLASEFGEDGREYFHRASRFHSGYHPDEADKQYSACLKHGKNTTLASFFHICEIYGIAYRDALKEVPVPASSYSPAPQLATTQAGTNQGPEIGPYGYPASWDECTTGESLLDEFSQKNPALGKLIQRFNLALD